MDLDDVCSPESVHDVVVVEPAAPVNFVNFRLF